MSDTRHLEGLRRLSPCCQKRVAHWNQRDRSDLSLICLGCQQGVSSFLLKNRHGQIVWPVEGEFPPYEKRGRRRRKRKVPLEAEPEPYHVPKAILEILRGL